MSIKVLKFLFGFLIVSFLLNAQDISDLRNAQLQSLMGSFGKSDFKSAQNLAPDFSENNRVDENRYIVDVGDQFWVKIDIPGPDYLSFTIPVANNGKAVFNQIPSVNVKGKLLKDVIILLEKQLKKHYQDAVIEVYFHSPRNIKVSVIKTGKIHSVLNIPANISLYEIVNTIVIQDSMYLKDQMAIKDKDKIQGIPIPSLRNVKINRAGEWGNYDLYKYFYLNKMEENPYLKNEDKIFIDNIGKLNALIQISGAVNIPNQFEYKPGDDLQAIILYARGLAEGVDSNKIEVIRSLRNKIETEKFVLNFSKDKKFKLSSGDRIFVRYLPEFRQMFNVEIFGEVNYPGNYAIIDGVTTLKEILQEANGLTQRAFLRDAVILRNKFLPQDTELLRLRKMSAEEMTRIERNYFKIRSRENIRIVVCDFEKMWDNETNGDNVVLRDGDRIIIPEKKGIIFVSGGVFNPGIVTYKDNWTYNDYVLAAGGFNSRARKGDIKIIKSKTGVWLDADKNIILEEGDIIFTPEKEERDWWEMFKEGLTIVMQVGAIVAIVINVRK